MGLYGALVVRPTHRLPTTRTTAPATRSSTRRASSCCCSARSTRTCTTRSRRAARTTSTTLHNRYFAINGREFPDTSRTTARRCCRTSRTARWSGSSRTTGARTPLAGADPDDQRRRASTTRSTRTATTPARSPRTAGCVSPQRRRLAEHFGETIGSGQTEDFLLRWDDAGPAGTRPPTRSRWPQPNYRNLIFKDGNTWYSGNPYLGYKGTLPTGTTSQNVCGEWYFPLHSHALNEFANFDEGFGGMATLLRVDPPGGCFAFAASTAIVGGALKSGTVAALGVDDTTYYQVNPKTTTRPTGDAPPGRRRSRSPRRPASPPPGTYYVRIDNEVLQVTGGQGTTTWTVTRGQLGTRRRATSSGAVVTALADRLVRRLHRRAGRGAEPQGDLQGQELRQHDRHDVHGADHQPAAADRQDLQLDDRRRGRLLHGDVGRLGDAPPAPPDAAQPQASARPDVSSTWTLPGPASDYIGTGRTTARCGCSSTPSAGRPPAPTAFSTWGNLMKIVYDAP